MPEAAREWRDTIAEARAAAPAERYLEVRYEELHREPDRGVRAMYEFLGLPAGEDAIAAALAEAGVAANVDPGSPVPGSGKWRDAWSAADLADFEAEAGPLREELGYEAAAAGRSRRRGGGLRERVVGHRSAPAATGPDETARRELVVGMQVGQWVLDRLLTALSAGDRAAAEALLAPGAAVRFVDGDSDLGAEGLWADAAFRGRQLRGDTHAAVPVVSAFLAYEPPQGGRADRVVYATVVEERITALAVYCS